VTDRLARLLRKLGYLPVDEVNHMLQRIGLRLGQLDEPLAREYVLDPFPGGIEHRIHQLCERRRTVYAKLAADELQTQRDGIAREA
jgi:hypothetical protein